MEANIGLKDTTIFCNSFSRSPSKLNGLKRPRRFGKKYGRFNRLSYFTKEYLFYNPPDDFYEYMIDDTCVDERQDFRKDLSNIVFNKSLKFFNNICLNLNSLSSGTFFESKLIESHCVEKIIRDVAVKWLRLFDVNLQSFFNDKLDRISTPIIFVKETNNTNLNCTTEFTNILCDYLADMCQIHNMEDHYYLLCKDFTDLVVEEIYVKINYKLEKVLTDAINYVSKPTFNKKRKYEHMVSFDDDEIIRHQLESCDETTKQDAPNECKKTKFDIQKLDDIFQCELDEILRLQETNFATKYCAKQMEVDEAVIEANLPSENKSDGLSSKEISVVLSPDKVCKTVHESKKKKSSRKNSHKKISLKKKSSKNLKKDDKSKKEKRNDIKSTFDVRSSRKNMLYTEDNVVFSDKKSTLIKKKDSQDKNKKIKKNKNKHIQKENFVKKKIIKTKNDTQDYLHYFDSFLSSCKDVYNFLDNDVALKINFNDDFDLLLPVNQYYENPLMSYFIDNNIEMLKEISSLLPNYTSFSASLLTVKNSFIWALYLYCMDANQLCKPNKNDELDMTIENDKKKGFNPLMQAFKQVVEANKKKTMQKENISIKHLLLTNQNFTFVKPIILNASDSKLIEKTIKEEFHLFCNLLLEFLEQNDLNDIVSQSPELLRKDITLVYHLKILSEAAQNFYLQAEKAFETNKLLTELNKYNIPDDEDFYIDFDDSENISIPILPEDKLVFQDMSNKNIINNSVDQVNSSLNLKEIPKPISSPITLSTSTLLPYSSVPMPQFNPIPAPQLHSDNHIPRTLLIGTQITPRIPKAIHPTSYNSTLYTDDLVNSNMYSNSKILPLNNNVTSAIQPSNNFSGVGKQKSHNIISFPRTLSTFNSTSALSLPNDVLSNVNIQLLPENSDVCNKSAISESSKLQENKILNTTADASLVAKSSFQVTAFNSNTSILTSSSPILPSLVGNISLPNTSTHNTTKAYLSSLPSSVSSTLDKTVASIVSCSGNILENKMSNSSITVKPSSLGLLTTISSSYSNTIIHVKNEELISNFAITNLPKSINTNSIGTNFVAKSVESINKVHSCVQSANTSVSLNTTIISHPTQLGINNWNQFNYSSPHKSSNNIVTAVNMSTGYHTSTKLTNLSVPNITMAPFIQPITTLSNISSIQTTTESNTLSSDIADDSLKTTNSIKLKLKSSTSKNLRIYVFNLDNLNAKIAQDFLISCGFKKFDPTNFNTLRHIVNFECLVLIQSSDIQRIHFLPNLLRLKRDLRVNFFTYNDIHDLSNKRHSLIFPRAGIVIIDITAILAFKSEVLDGLCQFMKRQSVEKGTAWKLLVNANIFEAIEQLIDLHETDIEEHVRLTEISQILETYRDNAIVELLSTTLFDGCPLSSHDYHACCIHLQTQRLQSCRHFIYVSDMPRNHPDARLFLNNGIDIMNIVEFMRCFVSRPVTHIPKQHLPFVTRLSTRKFIDAGLSDACQNINI